MNLPRSSILRLMASVALIGSALAILRTGTEREFWLGELAPLSAIGLIGSAMMLVTSGRLRRFFAGLAVTGVVVGLLFWVGPQSFRYFVLLHVLIPVDEFLEPAPSDSPNWLVLVFSLDVTKERPIALTRFPFFFRGEQARLGCLELAVAVVGGLLTAILRPRPNRPATNSNS